VSNLIQIKHRLTGSVLFEREADCLKSVVEKGAYLRGADLRGADLRDADLTGADLTDAYLRGADLRDADLRGADLRGADLTGADLRDADLRGADLTGADLTGADLGGADLRGAYGINKYRRTALMMLLDQPGAIRAYKLVNANGEGPFNGGIQFEIGGSYQVSNADTTENLCGAGINLATLDWCMKEWRLGYKILVAEFVAADIAAIPEGTDGKFRVHRCKIVGEKSLTEIGLVELGEPDVNQFVAST
jgi:uncharacterized protein YjbI with pentapeptide repeats